MATPSISIIVPVHNGATTLARALDSALAQCIDQTLEIIVIDDGSTDATGRVIAGYGSRVQSLTVPRRGPAAARNAGVAKSHGRFLAFLDADDVWLPEFLSKTVAALNRSPGSALAFAEVMPLDENDNLVDDFVDPAQFEGVPTLDDLLERWWPILPSAVVMRRDVFERCGGFCEEFRAPGYEDPWLWLLAREHGDFRRVHQALVLYRTARQPERIEKYAAGFRVFARLVKQRYGPRGAALVRHFRDSYVSALGYRGLLAMSRGDKRGARHAFLRALNYDPFSARTMLRMARTFMPLRLARAMTGRTRIVGTRAPGV
jgi:glycosyltransferase involved in cell wall biosynthesis